MPKRKSKFNAGKATVGDLKFDSALEAECYCHFRDGCRELNMHLQLQPQFELVPTQRPFNGKTLKKHTYTADFRIRGGEHDIVIDVKSPATAEKRDYVINEKLMLHVHQILITRITTPNEAAQLIDQLRHA